MSACPELSLLLVSMNFLLVVTGSPILTQRTGGHSLVVQHEGSSDSNGPQVQDSSVQDVVYLDTLTSKKLLKNPGSTHHIAQVLGFMMDLLQREVVGDRTSGSGAKIDVASVCASPCGRSQGTINIPLCFSCVGLISAHIKPLKISQEEEEDLLL